MTAEGTYLERILAAKRAELGEAGAQQPALRELDRIVARLPPTLDFVAPLREAVKPRVIAEFKRASPSAGILRESADPRLIAALYVDAGAACISVLTDRHFDGSIHDLKAVRDAVSVPLLCKDFILTRRQVVDARVAGADCVLLIVAALEPPLLRELINFAHDLGLAVLCEAHDERELERGMAAGARLVGVNARDLRTFEIDPERAVRLRARVPFSLTYVAESGVETRAQMQRLRNAGVDGVLIGSHLMRAPDPGLALMQLTAIVPPPDPT